MFRRFVRKLTAKILGPLARASQLILDAEARLALPPRLQENSDKDMQPKAGVVIAAPHLRVYEGGRSKLAPAGDGPLGRPMPLPGTPPSVRAM
ncbi:MAG: hypothetical protein R3D67_19130 [Hyphomicrobiaceae bacterium]